MSDLYKKIIRPALFGLDAETAHEVGLQALRVGLSTEIAQRTAAKRFSSGRRSVERLGLSFENPLGVAAGFDKNGVVVNQLAALGFGFVEVGTVTFQPQKGNDKPRLFRLPEDGALINRLGFNNEGAAVVAERLGKFERGCVVGVNIGKNKNVPNEEAVENYLATFDLVHPVADYIAINVSSPNTPNLRDLQRGENLEELLEAIQRRNLSLSAGSKPKPLLVKIAPDLSQADIEEIVDICVRLNVSGIIATNTTVSRENLRTVEVSRFGAGGVSGRPLAKRSNEMIRSIFRLSNGRLTIVGVGGISSPEDAFEKVAAGSHLIQAYTGFVYGGPAFARDINLGLRRILKDKGFESLAAAVGSGA